MSERAKWFIGITVALGGALVAACATGAASAPHSAIYLTCCCLACLASAFKVRLPGITGTMSLNFVFILIAMAAFTFSETVLLAASACVVQCLWRTRRRPRLVQVAFNVAALALSAGIAYRGSHLSSGDRPAHLAIVLATAASLYFTSNTLLVSTVLSLIESKPLLATWQQCYLWSFGYYLVGASVAGVVVGTGRAVGWPASFTILPLMALVYVFFKIFVKRYA